MLETKKLISFICDTFYDHLPNEAVLRAKHCLLDGLGVSLAGYSHPVTDMLLNYVKDVGAKGSATAIGSGLKTSLPLAALINGPCAM